MFTGIVEELGRVQRIEPGRITVGAAKVLGGTRIGDSIAVNGVCLTVVAMDDGWFAADMMPETLRKSSLGQLHTGDAVNLERAMPADGRFGGHIVSGHIDGVGRVCAARPEGNALIFTIEAPREILALVVEKGSIAIDGISLTVASVDATSFTVSIIPHTASATALATRRAGDVVNLENDIIGKYVQKLLDARDGTPQGSALSLEYLQANGF